MITFIRMTQFVHFVISNKYLHTTHDLSLLRHKNLNMMPSRFIETTTANLVNGIRYSHVTNKYSTSSHFLLQHLTLFLHTLSRSSDIFFQTVGQVSCLTRKQSNHSSLLRPFKGSLQLHSTQFRLQLSPPFIS